MTLPRFNEKAIVTVSKFRFLKKFAIHGFPLPNGEAGRWESVYVSPDSPDVLVMALTGNRQVILVKLYRFPVEDFVFELPGGNPEPNEDVFSAAKRELLEETGYSTDQPLVMLTEGWSHNGLTNASFKIVLARDCRQVGEPKLDSVEKIAGLEIFRRYPDEIMDAIASGDKRYDPLISPGLIALYRKRIYLSHHGLSW